MNVKTLLINAAAATLLFGGVAGAAQAQEAAPQSQPAVAQHQGEGRGLRGLLSGDGGAILETHTGLSGAEVAEAVRGGSTIAELIEANDESVNAFISEATETAQARIDQAVEDGRLSEERAARMSERLETEITERVNSTRPLARGDKQRGPMNGEMMSLVEEYTGLSRMQTAEAVREGSTIAELIEANGESVDAFVDEAIALSTDARRDRIEAFVNGEGPQRGFRNRGES